MNDIKLITLKTNHTLIAELVEAGNVYKLKQPIQLIVQPTKEGPMMGFNPFLDYAEEFLTGIPIRHEDVLCITTPSVELRNQYNKVFGSGIQIASSIPPM